MSVNNNNTCSGTNILGTTVRDAAPSNGTVSNVSKSCSTMSNSLNTKILRSPVILANAVQIGNTLLTAENTVALASGTTESISSADISDVNIDTNLGGSYLKTVLSNVEVVQEGSKPFVLSATVTGEFQVDVAGTYQITATQVVSSYTAGSGSLTSRFNLYDDSNLSQPLAVSRQSQEDAAGYESIVTLSCVVELEADTNYSLRGRWSNNNVSAVAVSSSNSHFLITRIR